MINRRQYVTAIGSSVGIGALSGCISSNNQQSSKDTNLEAPVTLHDITFDTVYHAVDDLNMDPTGQEPIDSALDDSHEDRTLIVFPPGEYYATEQHVWDDDVTGFGIVGQGTTHQDVQFVFPSGNEGAPDPANYWFLRVENGSKHLLENVTIQQTNDKVTGVGMMFHLKDGLHVHDVEVAGFNPSYHHDPGFCIIAALTDRDGVGVIEGFRCVDGGVIELYPKRKIPLASYKEHRGELRILDAHIENSGEHSMYVSRTNGCVRVEDGFFKNNDNSNLRMSGGGHPSKQSWAKNCQIVIDTDSAENLPEGERYEGSRGIWVESGSKYKYGHGDLLLENISVEAHSNARPAVLLLIGNTHGSVTVRNCDFRSNVERATPVDVRVPKEYVSAPSGVNFEDITVSTTSFNTSSGCAINIERRPNSMLNNVSIDLVSGNVDGICVDQSENTQIINTNITAESLECTDQTSSKRCNSNGSNNGIVMKGTEKYTIRQIEATIPNRTVQVVKLTGDSEEATKSS